MATLRLWLDPDLYKDAVRDLCGLHEALGHRHGPAFRELERRIEAALENPEHPELRQLGIDGDALIVLALPPASMLALIAEARRLQVRPVVRR